jgi:maleate isomerase
MTMADSALNHQDTLRTVARLGVLIPSTNTVVEREYGGMAPSGVSVHASRIPITNPSVASDEATSSLLEEVRGGMASALEILLTCKPDIVVLGMSAPTFYGGIDGMQTLESRMSERAGVEVVSGAQALNAALREVGAQNVAVLSPYQPVNDKEVVNFLESAGFSLADYRSLRCPTAYAIAEVPERDLVEHLASLARTGPDAIVQVGTNMAIASLCDEAERWLGLPVIAINAASMWLAMRKLGIAARVEGYGSLLRDGLLRSTD